jgi:hypothetical protein
MAFNNRTFILDECNKELDYDGRTDGQPVYIGKAPAGAKTTDTTWTIWKLTYDGSNNFLRQRIGVSVDGKTKNLWSNRANLDYTA